MLLFSTFACLTVFCSSFMVTVFIWHPYEKTIIGVGFAFQFLWFVLLFCSSFHGDPGIYISIYLLFVVGSASRPIYMFSMVSLVTIMLFPQSPQQVFIYCYFSGLNLDFPIPVAHISCIQVSPQRWKRESIAGILVLPSRYILRRGE